MPTVGKLRKALDGLDDAMPLLTPFSDHALVRCDFKVATARKNGGEWTEDHGEGGTPTAEYGPAVPAIIFE